MFKNISKQLIVTPLFVSIKYRRKRKYKIGEKFIYRCFLFFYRKLKKKFLGCDFKKKRKTLLHDYY